MHCNSCKLYETEITNVYQIYDMIEYPLNLSHPTSICKFTYKLDFYKNILFVIILLYDKDENRREEEKIDRIEELQ